MIYQGSSITVDYIEPGIAEFKFDAAGSVNKFDQITLTECQAALEALNNESELKGVICTSGKSAFIVGADITEFLGAFQMPEEELIGWIEKSSAVFNDMEDLNVPTVAAVTGFALGGGFEWPLANDYRVVDTTARVGLPEVKLGLMPGFGGSVRLPRVIGADNAMEWLTTGKEYKADAALKQKAVDAVVAPEKLKDAALAMVKDAIDGKLDWQAKRALKLSPLQFNEIEKTMSFNMAKGMVAAKAGKHYPAPMVAVKCLEAASGLGRDGALAVENKGFAQLAKTDAAQAQIGIFLNDQFVKGKAKKAAKTATKKVETAAVLGAGIMGGGIAYQSAAKGTPIVMKDINNAALDLGLNEAASILEKQVKRGRSNPKKMAATLNNITPSLSYDSVKGVDIVVEAVVENPKVKGIVLKEVEDVISEDAILTSNTSTISIDLLAKSVSRPENFCGMHFFNPVHKMPLVEVIRGEKTSDETVAAVVAYASKMGKTAIVVNDCPGFFVNRVLFPYFAGFSMLLLENADIAQIDKVMEKEFGWPMGPAYLLDVVGIDTANHCTDVMSEGFPTRMQKIDNDPVSVMFNNKRFGQKNGKGFYEFTLDKRGRPKKELTAETYELLGFEPQQFDKQDIIDRCMIPMINETIRCLEEGVVASPAEADMALLYGIGFPPFRGGVFRYVDTIGLAKFVALADKYAHLGEMYQVTEKTRAMAEAGQTFYQA